MSDKPEVDGSPDPEPMAADGNDKADTAKNKKTKPVGDTPVEIGGPKGAEPTRFGDWERNGRCIDF